MEITGTIKVIGDVQVKGEYKKREVVILTDEKYPQTVLVTFAQKNVDKTQNNKVGDKVTVAINLKGRAWKTPTGVMKYFNTLDAWSISSLVQEKEEDDLPF